LDIPDYCREIETYLCRKNDGHLIRVVGPSFELVTGWAARGVPLKVACAGIDRYFERYYRKGARRRPVKIDFCDADVLDLFDEWRKAVGVTGSEVGDRQASAGGDESSIESPQRAGEKGHSLPAHLERVLLRLSSARARGSLGASFDALIDRVATELDLARARPGGVRGAARRDIVARLAALDAELLEQARGALDAAAVASLERDAEAELAPFRTGLAPDAFARARAAAAGRLLRERFALPTITFE
jgi:hypothetical protein